MKKRDEENPMHIACDRDWSYEERQLQILALLVSAVRDVRDELDAIRDLKKTSMRRGF